jgi:hypothetical protein
VETNSRSQSITEVIRKMKEKVEIRDEYEGFELIGKVDNEGKLAIYIMKPTDLEKLYSSSLLKELDKLGYSIEILENKKVKKISLESELLPKIEITSDFVKTETKYSEPFREKYEEAIKLILSFA